MTPDTKPEPVAQEAMQPIIKGLAELLYVVETLQDQSEEYDFDDGMGRGAQQEYWDDVERVMENFRDTVQIKEKQSWVDAVNECVSDPQQRDRLLAMSDASPAQSRVAELERDNERLHTELLQDVSPCCQQFDTCERRCIPLAHHLRERMAELERDAERWKWAITHEGQFNKIFQSWLKDITDYVRLNERIDAARKS